MTHLIERYRQIFERIEAQEEPHTEENLTALFGELETIAKLPLTEEEVATFLEDAYVKNTISRLQQRACQIETCMEYEWAEQLRGKSLEDMRVYPYFSNYEHLIAQEVACLRAHGPEPKHILFVGAGPMPLSPMLLHDMLDARVTCMDIAQEACAYHSHLEGAHPKLESVCSDVCDIADFAMYDAIILAALVGDHEEEKLRIVGHVLSHMRPGQLLLLRNSIGIKRILYPSLSCDRVLELGGCTLLAHLPQNKRINVTSSLFQRS